VRVTVLPYGSLRSSPKAVAPHPSAQVLFSEFIWRYTRFLNKNNSMVLLEIFLWSKFKKKKKPKAVKKQKKK
jgi:hypothetical protein